MTTATDSPVRLWSLCLRAWTWALALRARWGSAPELRPHPAPVVLYRKTGPMSAVAPRSWPTGYRNVFDLPDGYTAWKSAGHPMAAR